jgi:hypothetical protein
MLHRAYAASSSSGLNPTSAGQGAEGRNPGTDLPVKGLFFSEEAENVTFRPPVASKQTKQILNFKNLKKMA